MSAPAADSYSASLFVGYVSWTVQLKDEESEDAPSPAGGGPAVWHTGKVRVQVQVEVQVEVQSVPISTESRRL